MGDEEKAVTADEVDIDVPEDIESSVRDMLRRHVKIWSGQLCEINVTEMRFELVRDAKPFKYPPFRAGPRTRELERAEIRKQMKAGVMEPAMSE